MCAFRLYAHPESLEVFAPFPLPTPSHSPACMQDPVITPHGYIFSREAIVENLLAQKKAIKRKLAVWEAAQAEEAKKVSSQRSKK